MSEAPAVPSDEPESAKRSWGFPAFAKDFPSHPKLDALVAAFERGDYAAIRRDASALADATDVSDDVRRAARLLRTRIEPDPAAKVLFGITAAVLVVLSVWWVLHSGPEGGVHRHGRAPAPTSAPTSP